MDNFMGHLKYLSTIEKIEGEVSRTIRTNHTRELKVVDTALDQILLGLNDFGSRKERPDNRLESARLFLGTRSWNSLRSAVQMLERGYYQQAMTLVRMAKENQLVALDAENHPQTLVALLCGKGRIDRFGKMAKRVSAKAKEVWDDDYGRLSSFGAHPRIESMQGLVSTDPSGDFTLQVGGHYDVIWVNVLLYDLLGELVFLFETTAKLTHSVESDWATRSLSLLDEVISLRRQTDEWAANQLGESTLF